MLKMSDDYQSIVDDVLILFRNLMLNENFLLSKRNTTQVKKRESDQVCMLYGSAMESLPCKARKIWEFQDNNFVIAKYHGNNSCELKTKKI